MTAYMTSVMKLPEKVRNYGKVDFLKIEKVFLYFRRKPWKRAEIFKRKIYKAPNLKNLKNRSKIKF